MSDIISDTGLLEELKAFMPERERKYFAVYKKEDQAAAIEDAKRARDTHYRLSTFESDIEANVFEQLGNSVPFIVWSSTPDGTANFYNARWCEYTSSDRKAVHREWVSFLAAEDRERCTRLWNKAVKEGTEFQTEARLVNGSGEAHWHLIRIFPYCDINGRLLRWCGTGLDVHDQKIALMKAQFTQTQFNIFLENLPIVAWGCDKNWKNDMSRGRALMRARLADDEMVGRDMMKETEDDPILRGYITRALNGEVFAAGSHWAPANRWFESVYSPVREDDGTITGMVAISIDVTDSKIREEANRQAEDAKRALEINTAFLANMSHEVRTPLNGIIGMADLVLSDTITEAHRPYLQLLKQSGKMLLKIVNEILDLSKLNAGKMELESVEMDIRRLVDDIVQTSRLSLTTSNVQVHSTVAAPVPTALFGDPTKVQQIITNLLYNAIKFTKKGSISVAITSTSTSQTTETVSITITDTGPGLSSEFMQNIFGQYAQEDASISRKYGGTGLGLSICHKLTQLMGGRLEVESEKGHGATFRAIIPFLKGDKTESGGKTGGSLATVTLTVERRSSLSVLVAEDNGVNQIIIKSMLKKLGIEAAIVNDGNEALAAVRKQKFDLVFMDCDMPNLDGWSTTRILRQSEDNKDMPIVALTAHAMEGHREQCLEAGMDDFITKPVSMKALQTALSTWTARPKIGQRSSQK
ncbi:hypothetical protein HDV00_003226 [Rhizophlyctis rosea]|nr:hypothetical protein HDV00_003226 [Rhizophlyctis rosea]